ncbi:hypothetical protein Bhyg_15090 [Pseudolycoriella hygida]|uniref:Uncharacterized protein n=1 Tax=Pseudolycoriella hygida TaxID=35572 RepID=A0A9Q0MR80_9DIPT|nr:hypothetical protein Bhyg_15090 [Pseudolycoriella hygida]
MILLINCINLIDSFDASCRSELAQEDVRVHVQNSQISCESMSLEERINSLFVTNLSFHIYYTTEPCIPSKKTKKLRKLFNYFTDMRTLLRFLSTFVCGILTSGSGSTFSIDGNDGECDVSLRLFIWHLVKLLLLRMMLFIAIHRAIVRSQCIKRLWLLLLI